VEENASNSDPKKINPEPRKINREEKSDPSK
jgi:hypothetical protein